MERKIKFKKPKVVAEIGCNHMGSFDIAKELILIAKDSGADAVKFQKRNSRELLTKEQYNAPHPNPIHSYGKTYGEHREFLEFSLKQHNELKNYCDKLGIIYSTSVWDVTSAKEIITLNPEYIKIPSASNTHYDMIKILRDNYKGDIHVSFGMTTREEEEKLIKFFEESGDAKKRLVIYACTSGYPVDFSDVSLLEIKRLKEQYCERVKDIGFSGHHAGIAIDIAAYTLGANWIERHFTKNRGWKGTDHSASLEPQGLFKLIRNLRAAHLSLDFKKQEILPVEAVQRAKLKYCRKPAKNKKIIKIKKNVQKTKNKKRN